MPESRNGSTGRKKSGQFAKGNPGGPGRPKGVSQQKFTTEQLLILASKYNPAELLARVHELISLEKTHEAFVSASKELSVQGRVILEMELANQRLAAMALNARLEAEVAATTKS